MNGLFKKTALALAIASSFGTSTANAADVTTNGGIKVKSDDGMFVGQIGGRLHFDVNQFQNDGTVSNEGGTDIRRLRMDLAGTMYGVWEAKLQVNFGTNRAQTNTSTVNIEDDAYIAYTGWGPGKTYFGQMKVPMGLDELTSSNHITFMERAMVMEQVAPAHRRGIGYAGSFGNSSYQTMLYAGNSKDANSSTSTGLAGRWTFTPIKDKTNVLHLGLALATYRNVDDFGNATTRYETRLSDTVGVLTTGTGGSGATALTDVENINRYGVETAYVAGPISVQAEYLGAKVKNKAGFDPELKGYYVAGSYFLTGESRPYKASNGTFDRVVPNDKSGAWELALRYSSLEGETDAPALAAPATRNGEIKNITAGLTYYANPQVRFMLNLSQADVDDAVQGATAATAVNGSPKTIGFRAQFDF